MYVFYRNNFIWKWNKSVATIEVVIFSIQTESIETKENLTSAWATSLSTLRTWKTKNEESKQLRL